MGMQLIETIEVGSGGAASIEFTSIPQDGVDLLLVASLRGDLATTNLSVYTQINGDTSTSYSQIGLRGTGSSALSFSLSSDKFTDYADGASMTGNTFSSHQHYYSNYTSSNDKSVSVDNVNENNATSAYSFISANEYSTSSSISSIKLFPASGNFVQYSTASLYKITAD